MSERQNIEWKESWHNKYLAWVCGIANVVHGSQIGGQIASLTARQKEVYKLIVANPKVSRKELAQLMGINASAVQKHVKALTDKNMIDRIGTKGGHWKIVDKN